MLLGHKKGKDRLADAEAAILPLDVHCKFIKLKGNFALCKLTLRFSFLLVLFLMVNRGSVPFGNLFSLWGSILPAKEAC